MTLAVLHRRLTAALALAALLAFMAGAGVSVQGLAAGTALALAAVRLPAARWGAWVEWGARVGILALCGWMLYVAFVLGEDFVPAVMSMLLFLVAAETLRPLEARNDTRLYILAFALLLAATAFYPGLGFAAAFAAFVVLATLALTVGYLRREAERYGAVGVRVGRGMLWTVSAVSVGVILLSATLFVLFPRIPRQWNVQGRNPAGEVMAGFSDEVRLGQHGSRIGSNPATAFRAEFLGEPPVDPASVYWRGRSFDHFDGVQWSRTPRLAAPSLTVNAYATRWGEETLRVRIFGGPPDARVLFAPHPVVGVEGRSAIRVFQEWTGDLVYFGSDAPVYTTRSVATSPSDARLRAAADAPRRLLAPYLQLPRLDPRVARLADSLTAGLEHRIDRVRAIERYLSTELAYTLDLPRTAEDATVEGFLFRRRAGHCEYFSTSMVMLLRSLGIPARNVTGFAGGEWNRFGSYLAVTGNQAHSWVEVWFGELGWVAFEPTPAAREDVAEAVAAAAWGRSFRFWLDGVEYRWYRWVVDYNLERQLGLFRGVGDLFSPRGDTAGGGRGERSLPRGLAAVAAAAALGLALGSLRRRRPRRGAETRAYLALRRTYARAGYRSGGPLALAERLVRERAPGAKAADALVRLYLRARFGGEEIGDEGRNRIRAHLVEARAALRADRRSRPLRTISSVDVAAEPTDAAPGERPPSPRGASDPRR